MIEQSGVFSAFRKRKVWWLLCFLTLLGLAFIARAVANLHHYSLTSLSSFLILSTLFVAMSNTSTVLPSGATWRPAMPLLMTSIFAVPLPIIALTPILGLIWLTARNGGKWWQYLLTIAHVAIGLYLGCVVYVSLHRTLPSNSLTLVLSGAVGLLVHLAFNRTFSVFIVAYKARRSVTAQFQMMLKELNWGYVNAYLICLLTGLLYQFEGNLALLIGAVLQFGFFRSVSYYLKMIQLEKLVTIDGLTQVENRTSWESFVRTPLAKDKNFTVAMIDLDDFKQINDTHGHATGDSVLQRVAKLIRNSIPANARIFRYGGDEFVVYFETTGQNTYEMDVALALENAVHAFFVEHVRLRISIGLATFPGDGETLDELLQRADKRMYLEKLKHHQSVQSKALGKDRM